MPYRVSIVLGTFETHWQKKKAGILPKDGVPSRAKFSQVKYKFMLDAPFNISNSCCNVMKKEPMHRYAKRTGRNAITAQMACESRLREQKWLQNGCNGFNLKIPVSNPMAFWTEQDVLQYIVENKIPIASVYGDIVADEENNECCEGQLEFTENGIEETECKYKTTGCKRTGCVFCGFGAQCEKAGEGRFERLKVTHPKLYDYVMRPWVEEIEVEIPDKRYKDGKRIEKRKRQGLNYKAVIDWINENNGKGTMIRY